MPPQRRRKTPHVEPFHPPRFDASTQAEELVSYLDEHGYAVVSSVCSAADCVAAKSLLWEFLEAVPGTRVRRDDPGSWGHADDWLPSPATGIIAGQGFGQCDFMWKLRLFPDVRRAFEAIWQTDDLLVSFDGGNAFRPWRNRPEWRTSGGWYRSRPPTSAQTTS